MHSKEQRSTEKGVFRGVNFGLHTITKITSFAQKKPGHGEQHRKAAFFYPPYLWRGSEGRRKCCLTVAGHAGGARGWL